MSNLLERGPNSVEAGSGLLFVAPDLPVDQIVADMDALVSCRRAEQCIGREWTADEIRLAAVLDELDIDEAEGQRAVLHGLQARVSAVRDHQVEIDDRLKLAGTHVADILGEQATEPTIVIHGEEFHCAHFRGSTLLIARDHAKWRIHLNNPLPVQTWHSRNANTRDYESFLFKVDKHFIKQQTVA